MKVLDTTFLIDFYDGVEATRRYFDAHADEEFVTHAPAYTEFLLGGAAPDAEDSIEELAASVEWVDVIEVDQQVARLAADVADEIGPQGPHLTAIDALVVAVARDHGGTVVSDDRDHKHDETRRVVDVDAYADLESEPESE